ncbi:sarcosine oxidase subunit delta [Profundibacterium mesophilum]|uniref:Sarcosine oxidase delta subunit protein n=1 Tax=Profundibacterium mesophilum KAUST100406-0324 TaxID=1037889 RepID=A0A921NQ68_9RHOB|nr:sarcosine oxidase subunit delta [Profundibacterium mesophilum]KAF0676701.1 putative sarcosine oxidase delta subunit protein [Profundibacterium mesophilum KAUST100406-0324]
MLILTCPACGIAADETELHPGGEAHVARAGPHASEEAFSDYLFSRENPRGVHFERWRHAMGCGKWFHAARCTVTLEIFGTYRADCTAPPEALLERIRAARPGWSWRDFK